MALATLTARVDEKNKAKFDTFCSNVGLNNTTVPPAAVLQFHYLINGSEALYIRCYRHAGA